MKSLFDTNFKYTNEARRIENRCHSLIQDTFRDYYCLGFSPREIAMIFHNLTKEIELEFIIENDSKLTGAAMIYEKCSRCSSIDLKLIYKLHEPFWECQQCGNIFNRKPLNKNGED